MRPRSHFVGLHDFASFARPWACRFNNTAYSRLEVTQSRAKLVSASRGSGFLWNMVRIMGHARRGFWDWAEAPDGHPLMLEAKDVRPRARRRQPHGLYLQWIPLLIRNRW